MRKAYSLYNKTNIQCQCISFYMFSVLSYINIKYPKFLKLLNFLCSFEKKKEFNHV